MSAQPKRSTIDWKAVGRRLREIRGFDTTQQDFARELGISQGQLSRYEKGRSEVGAEVLLRITRQYGKSIEWLLTGEDQA
jgi:transcriptional regulator with XRE-family HTH domain